VTKPSSQIAKTTRLYRKLHRWIAIPLLCFFFLVGATGFLLGLKKQTGLLPPTQKGASTDSKQWIQVDSLMVIASIYAQNELKKSGNIDRIDIRPGKGIAKIVYADHFTELQLDCTTGSVLSVKQRTSDIIEKIHDASILDFLIKTENEQFKLVYTFTLSIGLMLLSLSGFFLWFNPIRIKRGHK